VLVIDDAQWADEATLGLLTYGLRRLAGRGLLVLLTSREPLRRPAATRIALDRLGEADAAEQAVERALALADPGEHVWIVLTVAGVASLLERHPRHRTAHGAFLSELLDRLASIGAARPSIGLDRLTSALSARELEVLGFLPTNLTAVEIATELVLSVHTVKTHMRTLYSKLGVHRRADAVARARALGILAPARRGRR
jgi:LuxR family maltose regulon positive regulatory protein